jgi:hypothetical protein
MKKIHYFLYISILTLLTFSCKKDKMIDKNNEMTGTWNSIYTTANCGVNMGTPINPDIKLVIYEKGYYKLSHKDDKTEKGKVIVKDGLVTFFCSEKQSVLDGKIIIDFNSDSLNIDRNVCNDDYFMRLIRK